MDDTLTEVELKQISQLVYLDILNIKDLEKTYALYKKIPRTGQR